MKNEHARRNGVPKWLRQYNARYGRGGVPGLLRTHLKNPGPKLDHGAERARNMQKLAALVQGRAA